MSFMNDCEVKMDKMTYEELKDTLKTGDLILFSGRYEISKIVDRLEGSKWSHVTMVVRLDGYDEPLLYEATALTNLPNLLDNSHVTGPKVVKLIDRLETYGDDLVPYEPPVYAVRRLEKPLAPDSEAILKKILTDLHGLPNPSTNRMIYEVLIGRYLHIKTSMKDITCSGFIALTYEKLGLLKGKMPINGYVPKDFSTDEKLVLLDNQLSDEIIIELPKKEVKHAQ